MYTIGFSHTPGLHENADAFHSFLTKAIADFGIGEKQFNVYSNSASMIYLLFVQIVSYANGHRAHVFSFF
jgi:hypothetical protein